ncbi:adenylate/guanylate cyclase domain-containing protein [Hyalangium rubrum]|uniref:Adenylate/guanylate cyclase domain-containing protein n=1 Tax=Hyalangium rubrum TaxID=3103134 RepID=A0ABU5H049_9BACT|nr:adenylate/guanylate cyclase domain-containing protein [Hyalangium sp. s54d21]MDY7226820.1 adenylate/guanylate cyclase domain-containing protein [Hyalangium sp. s54d21]
MNQRMETRRKPGSETTVARFELARANEEQVLAESSVRGERTVSVVRLALCLLLGVSQSGITRLSGEEVVRDPLRMAIVWTYVGFALVAFFMLRRETRPNARRSRWMPLPTTLMDTSFLVLMSWRSGQLNGQIYEEMPAAGFAVMMAFSVARYSRFHVLLSTVLSTVGFVGVCVMAGHVSAGRVSFVVACYIALGLLIAWTNGQVSGMFLGLRRRDNLSRLLPRQVVDRVLKQGETALVPVQREVTILFSDIRDFTTLSETLPPQAVLALLDDYFGHMTQIVMAHEGMVNKFLGDGMMACWGVPDHSEDHAELAMRAALDMRAKLEELNTWRVRNGEAPLRIGIGLHTGVVAAGMLGGAQQHEYTIIGDAVNVASRVEGLTKVLGVDILVSESTWKRGGERFQGERMGEERVKGRQEAVVLYSLKGREAGASTAFPEERTGS